MRNQDLESHRRQFVVLAVARDEALATALAKQIKTFGYPETTASPAAGSISQAMNHSPHIILCDYNAPTEIEDYLVAIRDATPRALVIVMTRADQNLSALDLISKGLAYDSVIAPLVSPLELSQKIDRAAAELYRGFEADQLRGYLTHKTSVLTGDGAVLSSDFSINKYLLQLAGTKEIDETTQVFIDALSHEWSGAPVIYFKYLPTHASLPLAQAAASQVDQYRGFGLDLRDETPIELNAFFRSPEKAAKLKKFVKEVFSTDDFISFTHTNEGETLGLFVGLTKKSDEFSNVHSRALALKRIFELAFKKNMTLKEKYALDVSDTLTGLLNRRHFAQKLEEEVSRARRILMPLSLITIDCDQFHTVNERLGLQQADAILKAIATILRKTTRVSDVIARTGPDEFSLLLPHTGHVGAGVKAERLRRLIESTKFPLLGPQAGSVTVSCGVSEYPTLSSDPDSLVSSADEAISQVRAVGNKVCLATPPEHLKLDFTPRETTFDEIARKR